MASQESSSLSRFFTRLISWQVDRPFHVLVLAVLLTIPAIFLAKRLELRTGFDSLLPENKPSVKELKRVGARTAGVSTFVVVADINAKADGSHKKTLQQFGDGRHLGCFLDPDDDAIELVEVRPLGALLLGFFRLLLLTADDDDPLAAATPPPASTPQG